MIGYPKIKEPFIFKFKTSNNNYYIYDINTNLILKVEKIIWDLISFNYHLNEDEIFQKFKKYYSFDLIKNALKEVADFNNKYNVFMTNPIKNLTFSLSRKEIEDYLNKKVSHIILNITDNCNLRCDYCKFSGNYYYERLHRNTKMSRGVIEKSIDFLFDHSKDLKDEKVHVGFYGGEPFLCFPLIRHAVKYALKRLGNRVIFAVTTNGTLLNKEIASFLINHDFILNISIDGPENVHNRYRKYKNGKGSFDRIEKNLLLLKSINSDYFSKRVGASAVLAPNFKLPEVYDYFTKNPTRPGGVIRTSVVDIEDTNFYKQFNNKIWEELQNQNKPLKEIFLQKLIANKLDNITNFELEYLGKRLFEIHTRPINLLGEDIFPNGICIPGFERPLIGTDGSIFICEKMGENFPVGHIEKGYNIDTVLDLINNYIKISQTCINCWALRLCKTCFVSAKKGEKLDEERKTHGCKGLLSLFEFYLKYYCEIMEKNSAILDKITSPPKINLREEQKC